MAKKTDPKVKGRSRARKPAEETPKNPELVKLLLSLIPLVLAGLLYLLAHASRPFAEWYATALYPLWVGLFGRLFSWLPFSVSESGTVSTVKPWELRTGPPEREQHTILFRPMSESISTGPKASSVSRYSDLTAGKTISLAMSRAHAPSMRIFFE